MCVFLAVHFSCLSPAFSCVGGMGHRTAVPCMVTSAKSLVTSAKTEFRPSGYWPGAVPVQPLDHLHRPLGSTYKWRLFLLWHQHQLQKIPEKNLQRGGREGSGFLVLFPEEQQPLIEILGLQLQAIRLNGVLSTNEFFCS